MAAAKPVASIPLVPASRTSFSKLNQPEVAGLLPLRFLAFASSCGPCMDDLLFGFPLEMSLATPNAFAQTLSLHGGRFKKLF